MFRNHGYNLTLPSLTKLLLHMIVSHLVMVKKEETGYGVVRDLLSTQFFAVPMITIPEKLLWHPGKQICSNMCSSSWK